MPAPLRHGCPPAPRRPQISLWQAARRARSSWKRRRCQIAGSIPRAGCGRARADRLKRLVRGAFWRRIRVQESFPMQSPVIGCVPDTLSDGKARAGQCLFLRGRGEGIQRSMPPKRHSGAGRARRQSRRSTVTGTKVLLPEVTGSTSRVTTRCHQGNERVATYPKYNFDTVWRREELRAATAPPRAGRQEILLLRLSILLLLVSLWAPHGTGQVPTQTRNRSL